MVCLPPPEIGVHLQGKTQGTAWLLCRPIRRVVIVIVIRADGLWVTARGVHEHG
ncbi:hypothetical protein GCM10027187_74410 [Streptosporangium sandarakinum]